MAEGAFVAALCLAVRNGEQEIGQPPPPPLNSNRGGVGTFTFRFSNSLRRLDVELLLCVCWLDKVVLLVHSCVLQISCIQSTPLYPVSYRTLSFSQLQPLMSIILTRTHLVLLSIFNVQEAGMSVLRVRTPLGPTPAPSTAVQSKRRHPGKRVQLKLGAFLPPAANEPEAVQFPGHFVVFVVHMPSCSHVLLRITHPVCSLEGGRGDRHFGYVPLGMGGYRCAQVVTVQGEGGTWVSMSAPLSGKRKGPSAKVRSPFTARVFVPL